MLAPFLTDQQRQIIERPIDGRVFLHGPAGSGKTTAGVARLLHLLAAGVDARSILLLVPQRTLAAPYYAALRRPTIDAGGQVTVFTIGSLAGPGRQMAGSVVLLEGQVCAAAGSTGCHPSTVLSRRRIRTRSNRCLA